MKDEGKGEQILEFVGLRAKCYSYKLKEEEAKKCKGVKKNVVKKQISHEDYVDVLESGKAQMRTMNCLLSEKHEIVTLTVNKTALSANDDKPFVLEDGISTLAWGHWRLGDRKPGKEKEKEEVENVYLEGAEFELDSEKEEMQKEMKTDEEIKDEKLEKKKAQVERFLLKKEKAGAPVTMLQMTNKFHVSEEVLFTKMNVKP